jgi:hypothetical protein
MWTLDDILDRLSRYQQRATYGAVGGVLGVIPIAVMQERPRDARHSWVVSQETGIPTGYTLAERDPYLCDRNEILMEPAALLHWLNNPN